MHFAKDRKHGKLLFSAEDYHRLGQTGLFQEDDPIELLNGEIIIMSPIGTPHASMVHRLITILGGRAGKEAIVTSQNPLSLDPFSEPEPDLMLLKPCEDFYASAHPSPADVLLLIEVSDPSLEYDQGPKLNAYAKGGVPEFWIIDLNSKALLIHRRPDVSGLYREIHRPAPDSPFGPQALPGLSLSFADLGWKAD
jgi:Uma2 family endonuclease